MNRTEKSTTAVLVAALALSFIFYGVWEDKAMLYAPLVTLIYLAVAFWAASGVRCAARREANAERKPFSSFQTPPGGGLLLLFWLYSIVLIPFSVLPYEAKISVLRFGVYLATYWAAANILSRFSFRKTVWTTVFVLLIFNILSRYSIYSFNFQ